MTKQALIEAIMSLNRTASQEFLSQFSEQDLREYLEHLQQALCRSAERQNIAERQTAMPVV